MIVRTARIFPMLSLRYMYIWSPIILLVFASLLPKPASAQEGFVTCEGTRDNPCDFCHVISTSSNVLDFIITVAVVIVTLMILYAGMKLVTSAGNTEAKEKAKSYLTNAIIGLIIVLTSWLLIDTIMKIIVDQNVSGGDGQTFGVWHEVDCPSQPYVQPVSGNIPPDTVDFETDDPEFDDYPEFDDDYVEPEPELPVQPEGEICYPGCGNDGPVCFDTVTAASTGYNYPGGGGPSEFIDMDASHENMGRPIICGYTLSDFNRSGTCGRGGRFVYVDPGAVSGFSNAASQLGNPTVNSAFRSPPCNSRVGGAARSQHMYGRAFDIAGTNDAQILSACRAAGAGFTQTYSSNFVHCDWR